mmetsp:Transcript_16421/g.51991  ORF Transcript_16421/g.51991 Transcript_16421/m.51991 type:complete len:244 (-) Transcript_16421:65-796(-)
MPPFSYIDGSKRSRIGARLFTVAISRALLPTGATASGSAPAARRGATTDVLPERAASVSGVQPPFPAADGSALCRSRSASASTSPALTAAWMQPLSIPISLHPSDGSALCCSSISARGSWTPPRSSSKSRAMCSAVRPCMSRRFGSAPCLSSSRNSAGEGHDEVEPMSTRSSSAVRGVSSPPKCIGASKPPGNCSGVSACLARTPSCGSSSLTSVGSFCGTTASASPGSRAQPAGSALTSSSR